MRKFRALILPLALASRLFAVSPADDFDRAASMLLSAESFAEKEAAIANAVNEFPDDKRVKILLEKLAGGELYSFGGEIYYLSGGEFFSFSGGARLDGGENIKKITINNKLRGFISSAISAIELKDSDPSIRLGAAKKIILDIRESDIKNIRGAIAAEKDKKVLRVLEEASAIIDAKFEKGGKQNSAIVKLGEIYSPAALRALENLLESAEEPQKKLIIKSINSIKNARAVNEIAQTLIFGLSLGSVLLLAALGLAITFGLMKVINMAHGELIMLGAYTVFVIQQIFPSAIEYSILIAVPAAFLISAATGILIERLIISRLYLRPLEALLATFGISLLLQQFIRSVFTAQNRDVQSPSWMSGSLEINSFLSISHGRLYIFVFSIIIFAATVLIIKKTSLGLKIRAISQNREMARAMGVKTALTDSLTFGLGSGIAGVAGVALSQIANVGPNLGQSYIVNSFMVVVFGGAGNIWGTFIGAFTLGGTQKIIEALLGAGGTVLSNILILAFVILFIQKRPRGIFPQKGRDAEG